MSTTVNTGWLKDNNGDRFAPKTLSSQIITNEGKLFEEEIRNEIENIDVGIEITEAEYLALGDSVLTDGKTYFIKDKEVDSVNTTSIELTQNEYDQLLANGEIDSDFTYYITDSEEPNIVNDLVNIIYPIGSIYMSVNNISPTSLFGGTWEQIKDTFLLSAGDTYAGGSTGGEATHTHEYGIQYGGYYRSISLENNVNAGVLNYHPDGTINLNAATSVGSMEADINKAAYDAKTNTTVTMTHQRRIGNASYTSNLPPYLAVYVWKRTA